MIKIIYYSETIDNWGRTESSSRPEVIKKVLQSPDEFTDDMEFEDAGGKLHFIDDLIGKEVQVGDEVFTVQDLPDEEA